MTSRDELRKLCEDAEMDLCTCGECLICDDIEAFQKAATPLRVLSLLQEIEALELSLVMAEKAALPKPPPVSVKMCSDCGCYAAEERGLCAVCLP